MKRTWQNIVPLTLASACLYSLNEWVQRQILRDGAKPVSAFSGAAAVYTDNSLSLDVHVALYVLANVGLFCAYLLVVDMARHGKLATPSATRWALSAPLVFSAMLVFVPPSLSQDLYSYIAHGYLGNQPGGNPLLQPAYAIGELPFGMMLSQLGWHGRVAVSPYGVLWTRVEMLVMSISGEDVPLALLLFKLIVVSAYVATSRLVWLILGRIRLDTQLAGTLMFMWNPLVIVEIAGEGHNDAFMTLFVLAALWACIAGKPATSLVSQALGVITKVVPVIFMPAQMMYLWRNRSGTNDFVRDFALAALAALCVAAVLYVPLWAGIHTFDGLLNRAAPLSSASPLGTLNWLLKHSDWASMAGKASLLLVAIPALLIVLWVSVRVRDSHNLMRACAWAALTYVLLASPDYWPWYAYLPIAVLAASEPLEKWWLIVVLSLAGRFCAPLSVLYDHGFVSNIVARGATTGLGATLPLCLLVLLRIRRMRFAVPAH